MSHPRIRPVYKLGAGMDPGGRHTLPYKGSRSHGSLVEFSAATKRRASSFSDSMSVCM